MFRACVLVGCGGVAIPTERKESWAQDLCGADIHGGGVNVAEGVVGQ